MHVYTCKQAHALYTLMLNDDRPRSKDISVNKRRNEQLIVFMKMALARTALPDRIMNFIECLLHPFHNIWMNCRSHNLCA